MAKEIVQERTLPTPEERRRILERAGLVLAEARALMELLDREDGKLMLSVYANRSSRGLVGRVRPHFVSRY